MKVIKTTPNHGAEIQNVPIPTLRPDYLLCKVKCIALNPTDWKHVDKIAIPGSTVGVDFCGVVEEVGSQVTKSWKKGDRIAGFCHGGNESQFEDGAFGEYCVMKGDLGLKIPDSLSDEEAASLGTAVITCGQALYQSLGLPLPGSGKYGGYVLIYGGSTATGTIAIQYAVLSGAKVLATASEHNFPLLKSLGVEEVFSYKDPSCAEKIRSYTRDTLTLVMDCIAEGSSPQICEGAISSQGGTITYLLTASHTRSDVANKHTLGYTVMGETFDKFGRHFPAKPEDFEHTKRVCELTDDLLREGRLKAHPVQVGKEGLKGALEGVQMLREGKVSGVKLVYRVEETP